MFDLSYPARAAALANRVDDLATEVQQRTDRLTGTTRECGWAGPAAEAFRRSAHETLGQLRGTAEQLRLAADAIRRHGQASAQIMAHQPRWLA